MSFNKPVKEEKIEVEQDHLTDEELELINQARILVPKVDFVSLMVLLDKLPKFKYMMQKNHLDLMKTAKYDQINRMHKFINNHAKQTNSEKISLTNLNNLLSALQRQTDDQYNHEARKIDDEYKSQG